jgi:hypothetical protein
MPRHTYRSWDGLVVQGISSYGASGASGAIFSPSIIALPQMHIGTDSEGYIVAYRLDNTLYGDGMVGEGRRLEPQDLEQSNERMIQVASAYAGFELPFPAAIPGKHLILVVLAGEDAYLGNFFGHAFEGHERLFSAAYEPRLLTTSLARVEITIFSDEIGDGSQAKATFDDLFGAKSPECDQGCRFVVKYGDNMMARVDTEVETDALDAEALVWGRAGDDKEIMVAIEGVNSSMEELRSIATSLGVIT